MYLDANNLYGWEMSQRLPVRGFKWEKNILKFNEYFIKNYDEDSDKGYILEVYVEYPEIYMICIMLYHSYQNKMEMNKCKKLMCNLNDKNSYVVLIRALKQALNHGLILEKVHNVTEFNQEAPLKLYINMNTKLITKAKHDFEKYFFKLMSNAVFGKTMDSVRKYWDTK